MKKVYLLFYLSGIASVLSAQVNTDSLWGVWNDPRKADTIRLKAVQDIAWEMLYSNPDSGYALARKGLDFARAKGQKRWQARMLNTIGSAFNVKGDYVAALENYQKGLAAMKEAGDRKGTAALSNNIGLLYRNMGDNAKAFQYYRDDLAIQEELKNKNGIANAYNNIGTLYSDEANHSKALEYYQKSMRQMEELGDKTGMATAYVNVGAIYSQQGDYTAALDYYRKSLAIREEQDDQLGIATLYNNIGVVYKQLGQYPQALEYYRKGRLIQEKLGDKKGLVNSYYFTGTTFLDRESYTDAAKWCSKGLALSREMRALRSERNNCNCLYKAYKALGQNNRALAFHEQYVALNDSLQKDETNERLEQMELSRQVMADSLGKEEEKLKMEITHQNEVRRKNKIMNILLASGLFVLALALGFWSRMLYFRRYSQMFQNKAEHLEKQQLLNEIALLKTQVNPHFLFNSLSILSSLVRIDPDLSEQFIDQLSRSYRYILEQKEQSLVTLRTELEFIRSYAFLLKIRFENKFDLHFDLPEDALDRYKIAPLTLQLLIENAVKHNRMSLREPLTVQVLLENNRTLVIKNRLQARHTPSVSTGLGLQNIINRYALLTERPVWAGEQEDEFVVKIPLLND